MDSSLLARVGLDRVAAAACALAAAGFAALMIFDLGEVVSGMPITPRPVAAAGGAAAAATILLVRDRTRPLLLIIAGVALAIMVSGSLAAVPHTVLLVVIMILNLITQAAGPFTIEPPVPTMIIHLVTAVAAFAGGAWLLGRWRVLRGLCAACGRREAAPPRATGGRWLPALAVLAIAAALPYGSLKLAWALGIRIGLPGHAFDDVSFASPGFGDTALLTGLSLVASVLMGLRIRQRLVRFGLLAVGTIGSLMLVPVGVIGAIVGLIPTALGQRPVDDPEMAGWVGPLVYSCFLVWGLALCLLTIGYARSTRPVCRAHPETTGADAVRMGRVPHPT